MRKKIEINSDIRDIFFSNVRKLFLKNKRNYILTNDADVFELKKIQKNVAQNLRLILQDAEKTT